MTGKLIDVVKPKCRRCSKHRPVQEFVAGGPITGYCLDCLLWHNRALDLLMGKTPPGCQECERTIQQLSEQTLGADVRLYLHPKDGLYAVLCQECSDRYEAKRRDMYAATPYGKTKNL